MPRDAEAMTKTLSIGIVGAGLGGLAAALALLRAGQRVRVYEQAPALGEVGAGISISAGIGRALSALGIGPALLEASLPVPAVAFAHFRTGELLAGTFDNGKPVDRGFETARHIHRADLHGILLDAVRALDPDAVETDHRLTDVEVDTDDRAVACFANERRITVDVLVGADGTRSVVRRRCFDQSPPGFAGQVAFRCLVPIESAAPFLGAGNAVVSIGGRRIFHRYLVRHGSLVNVIGIAQSEEWQGEGWNTPATIAEFESAYHDYSAEVRGLIRAARREHLIKWALFERPPLASWHAGPIVLLGDAAHPILPFLGMGAALAIEDGIVLARTLAEIGPGHSREAALAAFRPARILRVEDVRVRTVLQGQIIQSAEPEPSRLMGSPSQDPRLFDYDPFTAPLLQTINA